MTREQKLKAAFIVTTYGAEHQMLKCVEELSELSTAIMQHINKGNGRKEIFEEICDVEIMLEQIKHCLPYADNNYEAEIDRKLARQHERMRNK